METQMTWQEACEILELHNQWRRGAEIEMQDPKLIGIAIGRKTEPEIKRCDYCECEIKGNEGLHICYECSKTDY